MSIFSFPCFSKSYQPKGAQLDGILHFDRYLSANYDSEFPSLSGGPQPQYQNPGQAVWANQRATQHTPVQRPQGSQTTAPGSDQSPHAGPHAQDHIQQTLDDAFFPSNASGSIDDYRHGGPSGVGQLSSSAQPQPGSIEEFPPLNRIGPGEIGQDRRVNMMQNAASGGYASASGFAPGMFVCHTRSGI